MKASRAKGSVAALGVVVAVLLGLSVVMMRSGSNRQNPSDGAKNPNSPAGTGGFSSGTTGTGGFSQKQGLLRQEAVKNCSIKFQGDADCDGLITIYDYIIWKNEAEGHLADDRDKNGRILDADFNESGNADSADFEIWNREFAKLQP